MRALLFLCCATFISFSIVLSAHGRAVRDAAGRRSRFRSSSSRWSGRSPRPRSSSLSASSPATRTCGGWLFFWALYRLFQDYVLSPHLMSKGVELHPLLIIFGVFAGGEIGGVAGIFLSVPVLALIRLLYHRLRNFRQRRQLATPTLPAPLALNTVR